MARLADAQRPRIRGHVSPISPLKAWSRAIDRHGHLWESLRRAELTEAASYIIEDVAMENDPASRSVSDLSLAAGTPVSSEQADCGQASATNAEENWEPFSTTHDEEIIARDRGNAFHRLPAEVIEQYVQAFTTAHLHTIILSYKPE